MMAVMAASAEQAAFMLRQAQLEDLGLGPDRDAHSHARLTLSLSKGEAWVGR